MTSDPIVEMLRQLEAEDQPSGEFAAALRMRVLAELREHQPASAADGRELSSSRPPRLRRGMMNWRVFPALAAVAIAVVVAVLVVTRPSSASAWSVIETARGEYAAEPSYQAVVSFSRPQGRPSIERVWHQSDERWRIDGLTAERVTIGPFGVPGAHDFIVFNGHLLGTYDHPTNRFHLSPDEVVNARRNDPLSPRFWGWSHHTGLPDPSQASLSDTCQLLGNAVVAGQEAHHIRCGAGRDLVDVWLDAHYGTVLKLFGAGVRMQVQQIRYHQSFSEDAFSLTPPAGAKVIWVADSSVTPARYRVHGSVDQTISLHAKPADIVAAGRALWVSLSKGLTGGSVARIDPTSGHRTALIRAGFGGLAVGMGAVWATDESHPVLYRINPTSNRITAKIHLPTWGISATTGSGLVWVALPFARPSGSIAVVDPHTNRLRSLIPTGGEPQRVTYGHGFVWASNSFNGTLIKIDPTTQRVVATIHVGRAPLDIAVSSDAVWVTEGFDQPTGALVRINPDTNAIVARIPMRNPTGLVIAGGFVWALNGDADTATLVDTATNHIIATITVGGRPLAATTGNGALWIANNRDGTLVKIDLQRSQHH